MTEKKPVLDSGDALPSGEPSGRARYSVETKQDGTWDWNPQTGVVTFSDEWKSMLGYAPDEIGPDVSEWSKRVHPEDLEAAFADVRAHMEGRVPSYRNEHRILHKNGHYIWVLDRGRIVQRDPDGKPLRFVGTHVDITPERTIREELEKVQSRFSEAEQVAGVGHFEFNVSERTSIFSAQMMRHCGLDPVRHRSPSLEEFADVSLHQEDRERFEVALASAIESDREWEVEYRVRGSDGALRWLLGRGRAKRDDKGDLAHLLGTAQDIDARKKAELALAAANEQLVELAQKAEQATIAKSRFLATMSHEIRTPLNGVLGMASVLSLSKLDAEQRQCVELIQVSGDALLAILNDILDLAKVESGNFTLASVPMDLTDIVKNAAALFRASAEQKGVHLLWRESGSGSRRVRGDPQRVRQILFNLIGNAVKFTAQGQVEVVLTTSVLEEDEMFVQVSVADSGPGIPGEALQKVFEPFTQLDDTSTRKHGGTGLGLAICRSLAEQMNGLLTVASELGVGSTFTLELALPVAERLPSLVPPASSKAASDTKPRVLVVEDNPVNRLVAEKLLASLGCEVVLAENGKAALEQLESASYDLIFMDCQMPIMDGLSATRALRERGERDVKVIALTANAYQQDEQRCLEAGMNDYLSKPISRASLKTMLKKWLPYSIS